MLCGQTGQPVPVVEVGPDDRIEDDLLGRFVGGEHAGQPAEGNCPWLTGPTLELGQQCSLPLMLEEQQVDQVRVMGFFTARG